MILLPNEFEVSLFERLPPNLGSVSDLKKRVEPKYVWKKNDIFFYRNISWKYLPVCAAAIVETGWLVNVVGPPRSLTAPRWSGGTKWTREKKNYIVREK